MSLGDEPSRAKHTPGPWRVEQPDVWPFDILITAAGELLVPMRRYATSTKQQSLADCLGAVGFVYDERAEVQAELGRQIADAHLIAAAPDLLEALKALQLQALQSPDLRRTKWGQQALDRTRAAIAKALPSKDAAQDGSSIQLADTTQ